MSTCARLTRVIRRWFLTFSPRSSPFCFHSSLSPFCRRPLSLPPPSFRNGPCSRRKPHISWSVGVVLGLSRSFANGGECQRPRRGASFIVWRTEVVCLELHGCSYLTCYMSLVFCRANGAVQRTRMLLA